MKTCLFVLTSFFAVSSLYAAETKEPINILATSAADIAVTQWYICPTGSKKAIYASKPTNVECQPARYSPSDDEAKLTNNEELQKIWYSREFDLENDVVLLPRKKIEIKANIRQNSTAPATPKVIKKAPPAPVIVQKPITPKQLILRDIKAEQQSIAKQQQQLKIAKQQNDATKIHALNQNIADRNANIQALRQELKKH